MEGSLLTLLLPRSLVPCHRSSPSSSHLTSSSILQSQSRLFSPSTTSSSPKVPLCLPSSRKNLLGILFVACKLTWFPTSLFVPTFTQRLHYFFFFAFLLCCFYLWFCFCFTLISSSWQHVYPKRTFNTWSNGEWGMFYLQWYHWCAKSFFWTRFLGMLLGRQLWIDSPAC